MNIIVFGASGSTGQQVVRQALRKGYEVTAFVRDRKKLPMDINQVNVVVGDAMDRSTVVQAIAGHDAVISCLGGHGLKPSAVISEMISNIVSGMEHHHVQRIVYMASAGIHHELTGITGWLVERLLRHALTDHRHAVETIQSSAGLVWTIARPMGLTNESVTGQYRTALTGVPAGSRTIARADVAHFMLEALHMSTWNMQSVGLASG